MSETDRIQAPAPSRRRSPLDWAVPLVIFIFCAVVAYLTTTFEEAADIIVGHAMQPRNFPLFLMVVIALLNLVLIVQMLRTPPRTRPRVTYQTWLTVALFALFYVVTVYLDMFIALALVLFIMCLSWGERRLTVATLVALVTPATIFFLFDLVLQVRFPRGVLTNLYYG
jgi:hypothetical protein